MKLNLSKLKKKLGGKIPASKKFKLNKPTGQPLITGAGAVFKFSKSLVLNNTFKNRFGDEYINYKLVNRHGKNPRIWLPRTKFILGKEDKRVDGSDINIKLCMPPKNEEQLQACDDIETQYNLGRSGFIIHASTGFGKTYLGCYAINRVQKTTLVLITKSDLETQWRNSFKKFLGLKNKDIGLIKGDTHSIAGKPVTIGYVQSVMKDDRYPSWVYKQFGMVIADEVHLMAAEKFVNCMYLLPAKHRLGLTATVNRSDEQQHVFMDHIGPVRVTALALPMPFDVVKVNTLVKIPRTVYFKPGRMMKYCNYVAKNNYRQGMISKYVQQAFEKGRNIVCFADTIEHLENAYDSLINAGIKDKCIGTYRGGMGEYDLKVAAHKPIVLTTYKMTQYGTDFPHWDCAVLMTPRSDVIQIVGRVLRENGDEKRKPLVVDFVDDHKILHNYWDSRRRWYNQQADEIVEVYGYG